MLWIELKANCLEADLIAIYKAQTSWIQDHQTKIHLAAGSRGSLTFSQVGTTIRAKLLHKKKCLLMKALNEIPPFRRKENLNPGPLEL